MSEAITATATNNVATETQPQTTETKTDGKTEASGANPPDGKTARKLDSKTVEDIKEMMHRIKINGVEMELPTSEVLKRAQMAEGARQKFELAAKMKKEAEEKEARLQRDFAKSLRDMLKKSPEKWNDLEAIFADKIREEQLDPRERKIRELEEQLKERQAAEEDAKKTQEEQMIQQYSAKFKEDLSNKLMQALDGSGLPKDPETVAVMAGYIKAAHEAGYNINDIDMGEVVSYTRDKIITQMRSIFERLEGMDIIKLMGDQLSNKIRKADLARLRGGNVPSAAKEPEAPKETVKNKKTEKSTTMNHEQFREHLAKLIK